MRGGVQIPPHKRQNRFSRTLPRSARSDRVPLQVSMKALMAFFPIEGTASVPSLPEERIVAPETGKRLAFTLTQRIQQKRSERVCQFPRASDPPYAWPKTICARTDLRLFHSDRPRTYLQPAYGP